jgi:type II secretion system protein N
MKVPKQLLFYAGITLWGLIVMVVVVLLFFPYQRALRIASQNVLGAGKMIVSIEGVSLGFMSGEASRIVIGHAAVEAKPLFELRRINVTWYPLSLLTGRLNVFSKAVAYDGVVECIVQGIAVIATGGPAMSIKFTNVNLAKYPEGTLPWFKGISGNMSGWIRKEAPLTGSDKQKGSFRITMSAGEIKEIKVKNLPNLILGYKEVVAEGRIAGSIVHLDKIRVEGDGVRLSGRGIIDRGDPEQKINLTLVCESSSDTAPLANGAVITVTGNQWSPTIAISNEPAALAEKTAARSNTFEMRPFL